jgi:single-strand DNA-binding protein
MVVANLRIATNDRKKTDQGWIDVTDWHRVTVFGKTAEIARDYLKKGSGVIITGKLQTRKWQKDGQDQYTYEIAVQEMQLMGGRSERTPEHKPEPQSQGGDRGGMVDFDDDIPFMRLTHVHTY